MDKLNATRTATDLWLQICNRADILAGGWGMGDDDQISIAIAERQNEVSEVRKALAETGNSHLDVFADYIKW